MKAPLPVLIFLALVQPASACRRFSIWHYNFAQPRRPLADQRAKRSAPPMSARDAPTAPDIPLPDLTQIVWGSLADEQLIAITRLRALIVLPVIQC